MPWRVMGRAVGALLIVIAIGVVLMEVDVPTGETTRGSCGSAFDAIAGRTDWEVWRAQDFDTPVTTSTNSLPRTEQCPDEVNRRILLAGGLVIAVIAVVTAAELLDRRGAEPSRAAKGDPVDRLRALGLYVMVAGGALTLAGLVGIVLLVADPESSLFLYVNRAVVALIGLVVLLPAIALMVAGRALALLAGALEGKSPDEAQ